MNMNLIQIMNLLSCNNKELSRYSQLDPATFSKLKRSIRKPKPQSKSIHKISSGVYQYALENDKLSDLADYLEISPDSSSVEFSTHIGYSICFQDSPASISNFPSRLNKIMLILDIKNQELGDFCHVKQSTISRFRTGLRPIKGNNPTYALMVEYIEKEALAQSKEKEILSILDITMSPPSTSLHSLLFRWLNKESIYSQADALTTFVQKIYKFQLDALTFEDFDFSVLENMLEIQSTYTGASGLRSASFRFLYEQSKHSDGEIFLFSDQNMKWMTEDENFSKAWAILMALVLKNNNKIKIIHNFDRQDKELFYALEKWLPLYFIGSIESYYNPTPQKTSFTQTLFLSPNRFGIRSTSHADALDTALYPYSKNVMMLHSWESEFESMLAHTESLLHIFNQNIKDTLNSYVDFFRSAKSISLYLMDIPVWVFPIEQLKDLMEDQQLDSSVQNNMINYSEKMYPEIIQALEKGVPIDLYIEISSKTFEDASTFTTNLSAFCHASPLKIPTTLYVDQLSALLCLEKKYANFTVFPIVDPKLPGISLEVLDKYSLVHKSTDPKASLAFHHPYLSKTLLEYMKKNSVNSPYRLEEILDHIHNIPFSQ